MKAGKTCQLRLFTWICVESEGRKEVVPTCPDHGTAEVRSRPFGTGLMFMCTEGKNHILNHCSRREFEEERSEAKARLYSNAARTG
jgi:hypothetical protein